MSTFAIDRWSADADTRVVMLGDDATGRWTVLTDTARYELDLDARTVTRHPGDGAEADTDLEVTDDVPGTEVAHLRSDSEALPLVRLVSCTRGLHMRMLVDVRGTTKMRRTTVVRTIRPRDRA